MRKSFGKLLKFDEAGKMKAALPGCGEGGFLML